MGIIKNIIKPPKTELDIEFPAYRIVNVIVERPEDIKITGHY
jgi:hypothetical protein